MVAVATTTSKTAASAVVFRAVAHARKSCPRFQPNTQIGSDIMKDILESTLRSPSSFNLQPSQILLVQDEHLKHELANRAMLGAGNQYRTRDCSVLAVFLADQEASKRISRIYQLEKQTQIRHPNYLATMPISTAFFLGEGHVATLLKQMTTSFISNMGSGRSGCGTSGGTGPSSSNSNSNSGSPPMPGIEPVQSWSYKNTSLWIQSYVLAATSHGLATSIMEGFDPRRAKDVLDIPDRYDIPMMVATGYEYQDEQGDLDKTDEKEQDDARKTPRLEISELVFNDTFGVPWREEDLEEEKQQQETP